MPHTNRTFKAIEATIAINMFRDTSTFESLARTLETYGFQILLNIQTVGQSIESLQTIQKLFFTRWIAGAKKAKHPVVFVLLFDL